MDKNTNSKAYKTYLILKNRVASIEELKILLDYSNPSQILKTVCSSLLQYINDDVLDDNYINNLEVTMLNILEVCKNDIGKSFDYLENVRKKLAKSQLSEQIMPTFERMQSALLTKLSLHYQNHQYTFLVTLIEEFHNMIYLKYILNSFPHYVNTKDETGKHIALFYLQKVLKQLDEGQFDKNLIYYHNIVLEFIQRPRFHLSDIEIKETLAVISDRLKNITSKEEHYRKKIGYYQSYIDSLTRDKEVKQQKQHIDERYGIKKGFNILIQQELASILKKDYIITIDDKTTLDKDDALSISYINDHYHLKGYISNVADAILLDSHIDKEAYERVESIYFPDETISVYPTELSNHILSLNTNSFKSVMVFEADIYENGDICNFTMSKKYITVNKSHTYQGVERVKNDPFDTIALLSEVSTILRSHNKDKTLHRTAEDIINYSHFIMNHKNPYSSRTKGETIIEETMILFNFLIADYFDRHNYPFIYRVHDEPSNTADYEKLMQLKEEITSYSSQEKYNKIVNSLMKLYPRAYYSLENRKHFGLGIPAYSHSTSPIRRYADVTVQRLINDYVFSQPTLEKDEFWTKRIVDISKHCNEKMEIDVAYQEERGRMKKFKLDR